MKFWVWMRGQSLFLREDKRDEKRGTLCMSGKLTHLRGNLPGSMFRRAPSVWSLGSEPQRLQTNWNTCYKHQDREGTWYNITREVVSGEHRRDRGCGHHIVTWAGCLVWPFQLRMRTNNDERDWVLAHFMRVFSNSWMSAMADILLVWALGFLWWEVIKQWTGNSLEVTLQRRSRRAAGGWDDL
jgi:hypothetical protein